jgi:hypothetical protein
MAAPTAPARSDLIVGIGKLSRNDATTTYITQDEREFSINLKESLANVMIGGQTIDKRWIQYTAEATINPDGRMTAAAIAQFWNNYSNMLPGADIFGSADVPAIITGSDGAIHTLKATAWTGLPSLRLHPEQGAIGPATLTAIIGSGKNWTDADAFYEVTTGGTFTDATWISSDPLRQQYSAAFGAVGGLTDFQAVDGFTVDFRLGVSPINIAGITRSMKFGSLEVMVRCIPAKPTTAQLLTALKVDAASAGLTGRSNFSAAAALTITGPASATAVVTIPKASIVTGGFTFSGEKLRTGEIGFYACRNYSTGAQAALYTIA